jgi:hypothetical protein
MTTAVKVNLVVLVFKDRAMKTQGKVEDTTRSLPRQ